MNRSGYRSDSCNRFYFVVKYNIFTVVCFWGFFRGGCAIMKTIFCRVIARTDTLLWQSNDGVPVVKGERKRE